MKPSRFAVPFFLAVLLVLGAAVVGVPAAQAQDVQVTSADPPAAEQGTINLDVTVKGKGFKNGAQAKWFVTGTTNPGGVTVNSTAFISGSELRANITVADDATIANFDIVVTNTNGRSGKGTELFRVTQKGSGGGNATSCVIPAPALTTTQSCSSTLPGCLDTTFGGTGSVSVDSDGLPGSTDADGGQAVAIQPDGKIVVVGTGGSYSNGSGDWVALRLHMDGALDISFGNGGMTIIRVSGATDEVSSVFLQPDGKILVAGSSGGAYFAVARLDVNGILDAGFGSGGITTINFGLKGGGQAQGIALQSDGKIVLAGGGRGADWSIARLNSNGSLDTSFGNKGLVIAKSGGGPAYAVRMQWVTVNGTPVERILVAGRGWSASNVDFGLMRFTLAGALDATFGLGGSGKTFTDFCAQMGEFTRTIEFDASGNIVAAGMINMGGSGFTGYNFVIARYTPNGLLDTTFGETLPNQTQPSGRTIVDFLAGYDSHRGMAIQPDGRILLSGTIQNTAETYSAVGLVRFNPDGSVDTSFGNNGMVAASLGTQDAGLKLARDGYGRFLVAGQSLINGERDISVFRFWH